MSLLIFYNELDKDGVCKKLVDHFEKGDGNSVDLLVIRENSQQ